MTPGGVLKGQAVMSEHAAGVELLREKAQVLACTGVSSWRAKVPASTCMSKARELRGREHKQDFCSHSGMKEVCSNALPEFLFIYLFIGAVPLLFRSLLQCSCKKGTG